ncbi:MAG: flagellar hook-associated protein FlgK [Gammaproteobacteria bacterium]|nr:flagellar hook-associated protein FlgK [Gammaproteobacteria bacterium]
MGSPLDIAVTGLRAFQTALATTSNNIANSTTPGYSRQEVNFTTLQPQAFGNGFIGSGTRVTNIQRIESEFLIEQLRNASTEAGRLNAISNLASRVDNLLADGDGSLAPSLQNFFNSVQDLSIDPSSNSARQVVLSAAESLVTRFTNIESQLQAIDSDIKVGISENIQDLNSIANSIADLNRNIVEAQSVTSGGQRPNDLLDQRDQLVLELSEIVSVQTLEQSDGSLSVFVGSGQSVVVGDSAQTLVAISDPADASNTRIAYQTFTGDADITNSITGGRLAGLLEFKNEQLGSIRNELGRIATVMAGTFNEQHNMGQTLTGTIGTDFFASGPVEVIGNTGNTGSASVTGMITDYRALTSSDYSLSYDGANYTVTRLDDGVTTVSAATSFTVDGVQINVGAGAAAGDRFLVRPTRLGASQIDVLISRTDDIAAASPVRTSAQLSNLGDGIINPPQVLDITDPDLTDTVEIRFNTPATTFDVFNVTDGVNIAAGVTYTSGADIDFNGIRVNIEGPVENNDVFVIERNTNAVSDNTNAIALLGLQTADTVGGSSNYQETYGGLVGRVGTVTRQAELNSSAQNRLLADSVQAKESVSGVNLDEEAVNLTKYQQAYQAAAQVIAASDELFQTLLSVVGR